MFLGVDTNSWATGVGPGNRVAKPHLWHQERFGAQDAVPLDGYRKLAGSRPELADPTVGRTNATDATARGASCRAGCSAPPSNASK